MSLHYFKDYYTFISTVKLVEHKYILCCYSEQSCLVYAETRGNEGVKTCIYLHAPVAYPFLTPVPDEGQLLASPPRTDSRELLNRGWVWPRVGLDSVVKIKILLLRESNPGNPAQSLITTLTELPWHRAKFSFLLQKCRLIMSCSEVCLYAHITFEPIRFS